ncbi:MAG: hypothetical protein E7361_03975 [Clostridiales bacterium]|nr:hypothetical protein [Clostridiales bacterium]
MSEMLVLEHKKIDNGRMLSAYLIASFSPKNTANMAETPVYKCYLPDDGRVAKVPEMSKYFFFNKLEALFPQAVLITSPECMSLVSDTEHNDVFTVNGHKFIKTFTTNGLQYIMDKKNEL